MARNSKGVVLYLEQIFYNHSRHRVFEFVSTNHKYICNIKIMTTVDVGNLALSLPNWVLQN